jgi:2-isopropylmalate synthase
VRTAEGNGPVNALDNALRDAITDLHPHLADIELVNYKVRILDEHHGTGAVTRVLLDSSDGHQGWGSIGVSENIIEASWEALVDSLEYPFQPKEPQVETPSELERDDTDASSRPPTSARRD